MRVRNDRAEATVPGTATGLSLSPEHLAFPLEITDSAVVNAVTGTTRIYLRGAPGLADEENLGDSHPIVAGLRATLDHYDAPQVGVQLHLNVGIPRSRGLGAKSSDLLLGALLACQLVDEEPDAERLLPYLVGLGADPLRLRCASAGEPLLSAQGITVPLPISEPQRMVAFVPDFAAGDSIDLTDRPSMTELGAENARAAALILALTGGGLPLSSRLSLLELSQDTFGVAAREASVPASIALIDWLRLAGIPAVLSGEGPTVISLSEVPNDLRKASEKSGWQVIDVG